MQENTRNLSDSITRRHWFYLRAGGNKKSTVNALVMTPSPGDFNFPTCHLRISPRDGAISPGIEAVADTGRSNRQKLLLNSFKIVGERTAAVFNLREKLMFTS